ncbi:hypothetical protein HanIR_Chr06g0279221 [Helianthus annuus]|nr:hypothetical protein HanIR_Chr06g0279221 [Helianthus annuus]
MNLLYAATGELSRRKMVEEACDGDDGLQGTVNLPNKSYLWFIG